MDTKILAFLLSLVWLGHCSIIPGEERHLEEDQIIFQTSVLIGRLLETELTTCADVRKTILHLETHLRHDLYSTHYEVFDSFNIYFDVIDPDHITFLNATLQSVKDNIEKELKSFNDTAQVTKAKINALNETAYNESLLFESRRETTIKGLQKCYYLHSTADLKDSIISCVNTYKEYLQIVEDDISDTYSDSPCMSVFETDILVAVKDIAVRIKASTEKILNNIHCTGNNNTEQPCLLVLPHVKIYQPYVTEQVNAAQIMYADFNHVALKDFTPFLQQEKTIITNYDLKPKSKKYFSHLLNNAIKQNILQLNNTFVEHQGYDECHCKHDVLKAISDQVSKGANNITHCYCDVLHKINIAIKDIKHTFLKIADDLKTRGNIAILSCVIIRNVYAEDSIFDCYDIVTKYHNLEATKTLKHLELTRKRLDSYLPYFKANGSTLPCIVEVEAFLKLVSESAVYVYNKCFDEDCQGCQQERRLIGGTTTSKGEGQEEEDDELETRR